jgi:hypothetical protein
MHERQAALIGAVLALILLVATPTRAEKDAATRAREGDINHWIEYYRKNREPAAAPPATPHNGPVEEKGRENTEERKVKEQR